MKKKFSSMGRVAIALVLALSLVLVMGVPVAALSAAVVVPDPTTAGATAEYTITFTTSSDLTTASVDTISIEFPSGTTVPGSYAAGDITVEGDDVSTASGSGQLVTITVPEDVPVGSVEVIFTTDAGIVNPSTAADYTLDVSTSEEVVVTSGSYTITVAPDSFWVEDEQAGAGDGDPTSAGPVVTNAGDIFNLSIIAIDSGGALVSDFEGVYRIDFSTTATGSPTIPAFESLTFTGGVAADTTVGFILTNADESPTITATCTALSLSGESAAITVDPVVDHLTITGEPTSVTAGEAFSTDVIVTAYDAYGNVATDDEEIVNWTCDGTATAGTGLPADDSELVDGTYTFLKADFVLTEVLLAEDGTTAVDTTITATEIVSGVSATATVTVNPAEASHLHAAADPTSIAADGSDSSTITITAQDEFHNTDTNYTGSVTFETNLGTLSSFDSTFVSGVAEATLTSTDVAGGTATVMVSSGTMDTTQTVTLTDTPTEVWVAEDGNDDNPGTEALPFATIQEGIDQSGVDGTVNVEPGTYELSSLITISTAEITLRSTGTAEETTIDVKGATYGIYVTADDVTVAGFTIVDTDGAVGLGIWVYNADNAKIQDNEITFTAFGYGIDIAAGSSGAEVSGNTLNAYAGIIVHGSEAMISGNSFGDVFHLWALDEATPLTGVTITDNTFPANANANFAILIQGDSPGGATTIDGALIEDNTITGRLNAGIIIGADADDLTVTNLTITGNSITNSSVGIEIYASLASWGTGNTINNNNIYGNLEWGIDLLDTPTMLDAQNNWWGDASGPFHATTNAAATGDAIQEDSSSLVDYRPWLLALDADPVDPVTSIQLAEGWNLISLPLYIPSENRAPVDLLDGVAGVEIVWGNYDPSTGGWNTYDPAQGVNDLTAMRDGKGYWVDMTAADVLDVSALGTELPEAPAAPPTYDVVEGWNLIGFKSTTAKTASTYLAAIDGDYTMIYGFADGAYFVVSTGNLEPGYGYWIAVTVPGTIYP